MQTKLLMLAAIFVSITAQCQTLNSSHAYAIGTPDGVNIHWDVSGAKTVQGCLIFKQRNQFEPALLITPEMIISDDSLFNFTDKGAFDTDFPPEYTIFAIIPNDTVLINSCTGFKSIDFEVIDPAHVNMVLVPWNPVECCASVKVFQNEILIIETGYDEDFRMLFDLNLFSPGEYYTFMLLSSHPELYARLKVTWEYLDHLSQSLGIKDKPLNYTLIQNIPNPFSSETTIRFTLKEKTTVSLEVYNTQGRLVKTLINRSLNSGQHEVTFAKSNLRQGIYFYRLSTPLGKGAGRMLIL